MGHGAALENAVPQAVPLQDSRDGGRSLDVAGIVARQPAFGVLEGQTWRRATT